MIKFFIFFISIIFSESNNQIIDEIVKKNGYEFKF